MKMPNDDKMARVDLADFFTALAGWRKYGVTGGGKVLTSAGVDAPWTQSDLGEAFCRNGRGHEHACPDATCSCGFYCYKTREDAEAHAQGVVLARVEVWGRIVEHRRGYRAAHMRILELFMLAGNASCAPSVQMVEALKQRYQIPIQLEDKTSWTSGNPYGSSSSNLLASQLQALALYQQAFQTPFQYPTLYQPSPTSHPSGCPCPSCNQSAYNQQYQAALNASLQSLQSLGAGLANQPAPSYADYRKQRNAARVAAPAKMDVLYGHAVVKCAAATGLVYMSDDPKVIQEHSEPLPSFDPVADRVNARLCGARRS